MFAYTLLKVVGYYDLSVLSMSEMGFQKNVDRMVSGWVRSIQYYFGFFGNIFAMPLVRENLTYMFVMRYISCSDSFTRSIDTDTG